MLQSLLGNEAIGNLKAKKIAGKGRLPRSRRNSDRQQKGDFYDVERDLRGYRMPLDLQRMSLVGEFRLRLVALVAA